MTEKKIIFGRLGKNPELRYTQKQEPVCNFTLAEQVKEEKTIWHKVIIWGKQAEHCNLYLKKGLPVFVRGQNQIREFTTTEGEKKTVTEFRADQIGFTSF
ncbi:MAG: single-stranded DNA-binding protein [Bacteriovoracia bacterium]